MVTVGQEAGRSPELLSIGKQTPAKTGNSLLNEAAEIAENAFAGVDAIAA